MVVMADTEVTTVVGVLEIMAEELETTQDLAKAEAISKVTKVAFSITLSSFMIAREVLRSNSATSFESRQLPCFHL